MPNTAYEQDSTQLVAGNRVIFVTDGITERIPSGLESAVAAFGGHLPATELCASVFELPESRDAAPPVPDWDDDRTVLVMAVD